MPAYLCISVTFLNQCSHGRADGGEPEWPPSPLRLFQALVAAGAAGWRESQFADLIAPALRWLEGQPPPTVLAPGRHVGVPVRLAVPNNDMDVPAKAWARRQEARKQPSELKTLKTVRPTYLRGGDAVHYLFELPGPLPAEVTGHLTTLSAVARSLTHLGWGVDMVAGHGRTLGADAHDDPRRDRRLEVWSPCADPSVAGLRVPRHGTLDALVARHGAFLGRIRDDGFNPVPALSAFEVVGYRRATDPLPRPAAAFKLLEPDGSGYRVFNVRGVTRVAGMARHAAAAAAADAGWPQEQIGSFVLGHDPQAGGPAQGGADYPRFAYLPLPTIDPRGVVSGVGRVLIAEPPGGGERVAWARRMLSGRELIDQDTRQPVALLSVIPSSDGVVSRYLGPSEGASRWSTVTPVVLPGYDDGSPAKTERLLRKAIREAGYPLLSEYAELTWRTIGFRAGLEPSLRYDLPAHLRGRPRFHVLISWRDGQGRPVPLRGPVVIGAGRYCGFGLFAAHGDDAAPASRRRKG